MPFLDRPCGWRLYFEVHGPPDGEPVVLLEGMGGDIPGWRRNIPRLARELRVVAYDLRGNGRSEGPDAPTTMATYVLDTVALLDHLGIRRAHVYGQSFGGMVAQELALSHPERVRTLVLAATHCGGTRAVRGSARPPKGEPWRALYAPSFPDRHPEHVAEDLRVAAAQRRDPRGERRQWEAMQGFDACDRLPGIRAPTLVLHGTEDQMIPVENALMLAERIPDAELVLLEGAGHLYHSERAEEADAAVLRFIRRHRGADGRGRAGGSDRG
ncbi:MAG TPA: alpha/beta fold hydrolase [Actinomycetota bacterium]|nr:alpha/beta fold hydrolase [Actinomycetota bacterium]